jgi:hypothetical protein
MLFFYDEGRYDFIVLNSRFNENLPSEKTIYTIYLINDDEIHYTRSPTIDRSAGALIGDRRRSICTL